MQVTRTVLDRIYEFLSRRIVYHTLFWLIVYTCLVALDYRQNEDFLLAITNECITLVFYMVIVYCNLLYLIPKLMARSVPTYLVMMVVMCAVVTPIQVLALFLKFYGQFDFQKALLDQQSNLLLGNITMALLSTVLRVIMDWWRYQQEKQELMTRTMQSELRFLKSQINPHFLFNTLNNLYALTLKKSDQAPEIVLKLSEIMRYMLYECNEKQVYLSKEILYMNNYLDLERLRQPKDADITFVSKGRVSEQMVAPLLFVPFVENSFKHGLNHQINGGGFVHISLHVSDNDLEFIIENSKTEHLPQMSHPRSGGIGLVNVKQRLQMLYPDAYSLSVKDEPGLYTVTLNLSL
jgi:two-component system, LytTR family, sensor kinase